MEKRRVLSVVVLLSVLGSVGFSAANELFVDICSIGGEAGEWNPGTKERPLPTIGAALKHAEPGTTILLRGGVYYETVEILEGGTKDKPLTIKAYNGEDVVIDGQNTRKQGILFPGPVVDFPKGIIPEGFGNGDYVHIEGIYLVNFDPGVAIEANNRKGIVIDGVHIANAGQGVRFQNCSDSKIINSEIHHCNPVRVQAPSSNIHIANNNIHHGTGWKCYAVNVWGPGDHVMAAGAVHSVKQVKPGIAECSFEDLDLSKLNVWGRGLQGAPDPAGFLPHSLLFHSKKPTSKKGTVTYSNPQVGGDIQGGQKLLKNDQRSFALVNNPDWDNKPFSPDGKRIRFRASDKALVELRKKAVFAFVVNEWNPAVQLSSDIFITGNTIHDSNCQGIQTTEIENLLIKDNTLYHNGASGMQIEDNCRNVWIEGNVSWGNSVLGAGECGIWTTLDRDVVVQNNVMYESQSGFKINQCQRVLVRWNRIYDNRAQYAMSATVPWMPNLPVVGTEKVRQFKHASSGIALQGGGHGGISAPPIIDECAFVHNTLVDNGVPNSMYLYGGLMYGNPSYPSIGGKSILLNNIIGSRHNENMFGMFHTKPPLRVDGNLYDGPPNARVVHYPGSNKGYDKANAVFYPIATPSGFEAYRKRFNQDLHSVCGNPSFADPAKQDFSLKNDSAAIDIGVPLAYATSEGGGTTVPVSSTWAFSDGFRTSKGEVLIEGDIIMLGKEKVRILRIDRDAGTLEIDRTVSWAKDEPLRYEFSGKASDAGAFEFGLGE